MLTEAAMSDTLAALTPAHFEPHLEDTFHLAAGGGSVALKLAEVRRFGPAHRDGDSFVLTFVTASGPHLPQSIYRIDHAAMGSLDLFLVPVGPSADGFCYDAVFT